MRKSKDYNVTMRDGRIDGTRKENKLTNQYLLKHESCGGLLVQEFDSNNLPIGAVCEKCKKRVRLTFKGAEVEQKEVKKK